MAIIILLLALAGSWVLTAYAMKTLEKEKRQLIQQVQSLRRRLAEEPALPDLANALKHPMQGIVATEEGLHQLIQSVHDQHPEFFANQPELVRRLSDVARGLRQTRVAAKIPVAPDDHALSVLLQTLGRRVAEEDATTTSGVAAPASSAHEDGAPDQQGSVLAQALERESAAAKRSANFGGSSRAPSKGFAGDR